MGPMSRAERIIDVRVRQICEPPRERDVVGLLPRIEAQILEEHDGCVGHLRGSCLGNDRHRFSELIFHMPGDGDEPKILDLRATRTPEVRADDEARAASAQFPERGNRGPDPRIVGNPPLRDWHVEVHTYEHGEPGDIAEVVQGAKGHDMSRTNRTDQSVDATRAARSTSRFEYPHSLSYQPMTLTTLPMTMVA